MDVSALSHPTWTSRLQETSSASRERASISYQTSKGDAATLSLSRDTAVYSATYDATGTVGGNRGATRQLRHDLKEIEHSLRDSGAAPKDFQQALHQSLKQVDPAYRSHFTSSQRAEAGAAVHVEVLAAAQTTTLSLEGAKS